MLMRTRSHPNFNFEFKSCGKYEYIFKIKCPFPGLFFQMFEQHLMPTPPKHKCLEFDKRTNLHFNSSILYQLNDQPIRKFSQSYKFCCEIFVRKIFIVIYLKLLFWLLLLPHLDHLIMRDSDLYN